MSTLVNFTLKLIAPKMFVSYLSIKGWFIYLIILVLILIFLFLIGLLIHLSARIIFKGESRYQDSMKVLIYCFVPLTSTIFSIFGIFFLIYSLILAVIGLSAIHNIRKLKSFFSIILPIAIIKSIIALIILGLFWNSWFY
jgi:hypothetical protein